MVARDMPTPLSEMVKVPFSSSGISLIFHSLSPSASSALVSAAKRTVSMASLALLISSRKKMSLCEYSEWMIRCKSCFSSVLNGSVSVMSFSVGCLS